MTADELMKRTAKLNKDFATQFVALCVKKVNEKYLDKPVSLLNLARDTKWIIGDEIRTQFKYSLISCASIFVVDDRGTSDEIFNRIIDKISELVMADMVVGEIGVRI